MTASDREPFWFRTYDDITTWIAHPDEMIQRASHLVPFGDERYVVEPVDHPQLEEHLELADVAGVVVLMDRHSRDSAEIARRLDVPVYAPRTVSSVRQKLDIEVAPLEEVIDTSEVRLIDLYARRFWQEVAVWLPQTSTLIVPEAVGMAPYFIARGEDIGVHPLARLRPPRRALKFLQPDRLFVGHGRPRDDLEMGELDQTLAMARLNVPRAWLQALWSVIRQPF